MEIISADQLRELRDSSELVQEHDTCICGLIAIMRKDHEYLIIEESDKKEILLRKSDSLDSARKFVSDRLETYERMWDGCGCKINYREEI